MTGDWNSLIADSVNSFVNFNTTAFQAQGSFLLGALAMIAFSWIGIRSLMEQQAFNQVIGSALVAILTVGMASFMKSPEFGNSIDSGFTKLAGTFLPSLASANDPTGQNSAGHLVGGVVGEGLYAIKEMWYPSEQPTTADGAAAPGSTDWWRSLSAAAEGVANAFAGMMAFLPMIFYKGICTILMLCSSLIAGAIFLYALMMVKIGLLMAPILVPWMVLENTRFLAEGWFRFMVTAGMQKLVAAILAANMAQILHSASERVVAAGGDAVAGMFIYSAVTIVLGMCAFLMMQAPSIASALLSGGGGFNIAKLIPSGMTPGATATRGGAAAQKVTGGVGGAAGGAAAGAVSGARAGAGVSGTMRTALQGARAGMAAGYKRATPGNAATPITGLRTGYQGAKASFAKQAADKAAQTGGGAAASKASAAPTAGATGGGTAKAKTSSVQPSGKP